MTSTSTIFALSSGPGKAGVAVIRVSGPAARDVIARMAAPVPQPREAAFRSIRHPETGALLDRAVVIFFAGPKSETGEDVVELQVHGGRAVVSAVLDALGQIPGCRLAEPGEFARLAFTNGKLDLAQIEGLADLIDAETEAQRRQALAQAGGALSKLYEGWRARLIEVAALTEASIDFSDEGDVGSKSLEAARERAGALRSEILTHLDDGRRGEILRDGFRVALLGAPNAGKSSLLNTLARREAAIVSEEAGTTRDVIEVRLDLSGYPVIVSDTAGLREAAGKVEQEGMRRSLAAARSADLVLWLVESSHDSSRDSNLPPNSISRETLPESLWTVWTKTDLARNDAKDRFSPWGEAGRRPDEGAENYSKLAHPLTPTLSPGGEGVFAVSAKTGEGITDLVARIGAAAADRLGDQAAPALTQDRHRVNLQAATAALDDMVNGDPSAAELRAEDVRRAAHALGRITGRVDVEDVLGQIFSRFCIGK